MAIGLLAALRAPPGREQGRVICTVIVLGTTYCFVNMAEIAMVDMVFALTIVLSLFSLFLAPAGALRARNWNCFFVFTGLAVLAKGPLGLVLPLLIGFSVFAAEFGLWPAFRKFSKPRLGWLLFVIIACPWYLLAARHGQEGFLERQLIFENIARLLGGSGVNSESPWFYLGSFLRTGAPWSWIFAAIVISGCAASNRCALSHSDNVGAWWLGVGLVFFSVAEGKRHSYLLPLVPGLALFIGEWLETKCLYLSDFGRQRLLGFLRNLATGLCVLILGLLAIIFSLQHWAGALPPALLLAQRMILDQGHLPALVLLFALLASSLLYLTRYSRMTLSLARIWILATALWLVGTQTGLGLKNYFKGFDRIADEINDRVAVNQPLYVFREKGEEYYDPVLLYLRRSVTLVEPGFSWPSDGPAVIRRDRFADLVKQAAQHGLVLITGAVFRQRLDSADGESDRDLIFFTIQPAEVAPSAVSGLSDGPTAALSS